MQENIEPNQQEIPVDVKETEDDSKVKVLDLGIGEKDSLVAMEMQDSQKMGFKRVKHTAARKKSIDRIFGKIDQVEVENKVDKTKLKGCPRRSLLALDIANIMSGPAESDDEEAK